MMDLNHTKCGNGVSTTLTKSTHSNPNEPVQQEQRELEEKKNLSSRGVKPTPYNDNPDLPLYMIDQVPKHLADNKYIISGYRFDYTTRMCFRSIFSLHNETFNIWTHLVGYMAFLVVITIFFAVVLIPSLREEQRETMRSTEEVSGINWVTIFILGAFSFGCLMCMLCSTLFHTLIPHESMVLYAWAHSLDYFGITFLVVGSFLPFCYFSFACEPFWRWTYLTMILSFGVIGVLGPFFRQWTQQQHAKRKVLFYVCMVGSGLFPIIHMYVLLPGNVASSFVEGLLLMMTLYGVGVVVYVFQIPEFFFPGHFDIFLSSHQIWHVFVLAAAFVHFFNCASMYINFQRMDLSC
ncbi:adiponectin receptor protein 1 [Trypanosoma theileri]|uniref:Adiponectin receptor protein 1 n=1 Tax=Trypanosoma theileri TaxID=67003 RepID=A0A1X0P1Q2_9TRYP|nr:adiponectin receptor protein 1 [Trypanosoma theileri]ORC90330.1 adiponectin receptor protein 1 [Trypanosoma theileri]